MNRKQVHLYVHGALFLGLGEIEFNGQKYPIVKRPDGLRSCSFIGQTGTYEVWEQNPKKDSSFGELARKGAKVSWMFMNGDYYSRVVNDQYSLLAEAIAPKPTGNSVSKVSKVERKPVAAAPVVGVLGFPMYQDGSGDPDEE